MKMGFVKSTQRYTELIFWKAPGWTVIDVIFMIDVIKLGLNDVNLANHDFGQAAPRVSMSNILNYLSKTFACLSVGVC